VPCSRATARAFGLRPRIGRSRLGDDGLPSSTPPKRIETTKQKMRTIIYSIRARFYVCAKRVPIIIADTESLHRAMPFARVPNIRRRPVVGTFPFPLASRGAKGVASFVTGRRRSETRPFSSVFPSSFCALFRARYAESRTCGTQKHCP